MADLKHSLTPRFGPDYGGPLAGRFASQFASQFGSTGQKLYHAESCRFPPFLASHLENRITGTRRRISAAFKPVERLVSSA